MLEIFPTGLPHNREMGITQTPDCYLWLATPYGLTRFDGVRFTPFWKRLSTDEGGDHIYSVFTARDGSLWAGSIHGGVGRWRDGRFEIVVPESADGQAVTTFAEDADGAIWFGVGGRVRVCRWKDGALTWFSAADGLAGGPRATHETRVAATRAGRLWYYDTTACGPFDGRRFASVGQKAGGYVHLAAAGASGMWALRDRSLVRYHADGRTETVVADLGSLSVHLLFEDSSGTLWIGSNNAGLIRFRGGEFVRVPVEGAVWSLFEDEAGDIWAGTSAAGVTRLHPRRFSLRRTGDGLLDDDTYSICEDAEGRLWLAGRNRMLVRGDPGNRSFRRPEGWEREWAVMTVIPDPAGGVWLGTLGGLVHWKSGVTRRERFFEPLTALLTDRAGDLWMATTRGALFRRSGAEYFPVGEEEGLSRILALAEDGAGRLWAGGADGRVYRRSEGRFHPVPLPGATSDAPVRFIAADGAETVWIGLLHRGLYRWRAGKVSRLPEDVGLPTRDIRMLAPGIADDLWIGTERGLFQVPRAGLEAAMDGRGFALTARSYGRYDGLPTAEFALGFRGSTVRTRDGHLWFATARGALDIDLRAVLAQPASGRVVIDEVWCGDGLVARGDFAVKRELPPRPQWLKISYTLPHPGEADRLRFRYRMLGAGDDGWAENGGQRVVTFSHLPAGNYRFEVMAGKDDGTWLPEVAAMEFTVRAAWWEKPAARAGAILLGLAAMAWLVRGIVLWRVRTRIRRLQQARELERERARIARDMHDELGANLTHIGMISHLGRVEPPEAAQGHLEEIASIARRTVDSLDEIVWAVNPRYDTLAALIEYLGMQAASFLASARIACETELPKDLPPRPLSANVRYHLFLAVKEALNNAARHSGARLVRLLVAWDGRRLRVEVADDGKGFEVGEPPAGAEGLKNLHERMAEIQGECRIESRPGRGTRVVLELPLSAEGGGLGPVPG